MVLVALGAIHNEEIQRRRRNRRRIIAPSASARICFIPRSKTCDESCWLLLFEPAGSHGSNSSRTALHMPPPFSKRLRPPFYRIFLLILCFSSDPSPHLLSRAEAQPSQAHSCPLLVSNFEHADSTEALVWNDRLLGWAAGSHLQPSRLPVRRRGARARARRRKGSRERGYGIGNEGRGRFVSGWFDCACTKA